MRALLALAIPLAAASAFAQPATEPPAPLLTTTESIQSLPSAQVGRGPRAHLRGVVSFSEENWRLLFIQDNSGGIYCETSSIGPLPPLGAEVVADGVVGSGSFMPVLNLERLQVVGTGRLPPGNPVSVADLWQGKFDADLVQVSGHVVRAWTERVPAPHLRLVIREGEQSLLASVFGSDAPAPANLPGSKVRIDGVFAPVAANRVINEVTVLAGQASALAILSTVDEVIRELPRLGPTEILGLPHSQRAFAGSPPLVARGTVRAVVESGFWLEDGHQGIRVQMPKDHGVKYGETVVVLASPVSEGVERVLNGIRLVEKTAGPPERHENVESDGLFDWRRYGSVVETEGEFLHRISHPDGQILVLRQAGQTFEAHLGFAPAEQVARLQAGSQIRVRGV